jgi:hypothetical protein
MSDQAQLPPGTLALLLLKAMASASATPPGDI